VPDELGEFAPRVPAAASDRRVPAAASDRPLRILQVAATAVGGAWFHDQVTGLARRGHTVCAVLPRSGPLADRLLAAGIRVEIIPFGLTRRVRQLPHLAAAEWRLLRFIRSFRPDVIHAHLVIAVLACRAGSFGYPRALRVTQAPGMPGLHNRLLRWLDQRTLFRDHLLIGSCQAIARQYRAIGARRVAVSYYGCHVHRLDPRTPAAGFRREFGLTDRTPTAGIVAHMYPNGLTGLPDVGVKGHEVFLDAASLILERMPDARLFVVGDELAGSGDYRRALEDRASALGLNGRVHFTGYRADIANVLAGLDVVVSPSIQESACYTMVEALLMERGVVASDVGGLPDTVQHGETGLLVPPAEPVALASAVTRLLSDPARRREMGRLGRARCLRRFDVDTTVAQLDGLYRSVLDELPAVRRRVRGGPPAPEPRCAGQGATT
jgi:glycosyltransferase involved in cell wall biosynthesis